MKRVLKYTLMILAVATVGLSVQAWASPEVAPVAAAAVEAVEADIDLGESLMNFVEQSGLSGIVADWRVLVMLIISCLLLYLAIVKQFEPLLLLPIAFGMLLTNLPGAGMYHTELFADGHVHWTTADGTGFDRIAGLIDFLYLGVKLGIYPCLIFVGVGAMTDFGPLIANPKSLLLGAAAQFGIFATFVGATALGFAPAESGSIAIIGGADGPTAIYLTSKLAPHLLGPIAVAAYSYMALVPVIQPPIMKLLTTEKERKIEMKQLRTVSQREKIIFPIVILYRHAIPIVAVFECSFLCFCHKLFILYRGLVLSKKFVLVFHGICGVVGVVRFIRDKDKTGIGTVGKRITKRLEVMFRAYDRIIGRVQNQNVCCRFPKRLSCIAVIEIGILGAFLCGKLLCIP